MPDSVVPDARPATVAGDAAVGPDPRPTSRTRARRSGIRVGLIALAALVLVGVAVLSVFVGSGRIAPDVVIAALTGDGVTTNDLLVRDFRVPRTLLAMLSGLAFALSGVLMQALTRNPLADPGILGVNAGAYFAIVVGTGFFGAGVASGQTLWGILGAAVAAIVVYVIGTTGFAAGTPAKLVLAGVSIGAVLAGVTRAITFTKPEVFDNIRFWSVGSIQGRQFDSVHAVWLIIVIAAGVVVLLARSLNAFTLGDDVARALGARVPLVRALSFAAITVLCGSATAVVGPISFVGLVVPFVARFTVGVDQRWIIAFSLVAGPALMVLADVIGRVIVASELPVGVVTAVIGAPLLIVLVRRTKLQSL